MILDRIKPNISISGRLMVRVLIVSAIISFIAGLATNFIYCSIKSTPTYLDYEPGGVNFQKYLEMLINAE